MPRKVKPEDATVTYTFKEVIDQINAKFDKIDAKFDKIDDKFDKIDARFEHIDVKFDHIDVKFNWLTGLLFAVLLSCVATLITVILK